MFELAPSWLPPFVVQWVSNNPLHALVIATMVGMVVWSAMSPRGDGGFFDFEGGDGGDGD